MKEYKELQKKRETFLYQTFNDEQFLFWRVSKADLLVVLSVFALTFIVFQGVFISLLSAAVVLLVLIKLRKKYGRAYLISIVYKTVGIRGLVNPKTVKILR